MRKARGAVCAAAAKLWSPSARARSTARKVFTSSLHEGPGADVEILAHGYVHEAAHVAQRPRDMAPAPHVLGEDEVSRQAKSAVAVARLELEDARGEENQLAPRSVVKILDVAFGGLAEENRVASEGFRRGPFGPGHRHLADLDRRFPRFPGEYPDDAHARDYRGSGLSRSPGKAWAGSLPTFARVGKGLPLSLWTTSRKHFATLESKPSLSEEAGRIKPGGVFPASKHLKPRGTRRGIATVTSEGTPRCAYCAIKDFRRTMPARNSGGAIS